MEVKFAEDAFDGHDKAKAKDRKQNDFRFWLNVIISITALVIASLSLNIQMKEQRKQPKQQQSEKPKSANKDSLSSRNSLKK
jgi:hypothetical protein